MPTPLATVRRAAVVAGLTLTTGCANVLNYTSPDGPFYSGLAPGVAPALAPDTTAELAKVDVDSTVVVDPTVVVDSVVPGEAAFKVVTFNVKMAHDIAGSIALLTGDASLRGADVVALQEMDREGVTKIAAALGMHFVYYPASLHPTNKRTFGPAVLSRWPIERSWKVVLPGESIFRRQRRTATAAIVRVRDTAVRVYAVHLETPIQLGPGARRAQAEALLADARSATEPVIIAGDFNSRALGAHLESLGLTWATRAVGRTLVLGQWDHVLTRGLSVVPDTSAGVVKSRGVSDHDAVWARLTFAAPERAGTSQ
jgi:endonuclease/exonuclease/phosphatase family metal-dependent hydrolase